MRPYMRSAGFVFSDRIIYRKFVMPKEKLEGRIVAVR